MSTTHHSQVMGISRRGGIALAVIFAFLGLAVFSVTGLGASPARAAETVTYSAEELIFFAQLNQYRQANDKGPLLLSDKLSLAAQRHSSDLGKYKYFDHRTGYENNVKLSGTRTDYFWTGAWPWDRMTVSGYEYGTCKGENIAAGYTTGASVLQGFKESPGHNELLLYSDYKVVGIGQVYVSGSKYGWYWTIDFGGYVDPTAHEAGVYQQSDSRLTYAGSWSYVSTSAASGGSLVYAVSQGSGLVAKFEGTGIQVIGKKGPDQGLALIGLDGGPEEQIDLYDSTAIPKAFIYEKRGLDATTHTLTIRWAARTEGTTGGSTVVIDAFNTEGTPECPGRLVQAPCPTRTEQENALLKYSGSWIYSWTWAASNSSFRYAKGAGVAVTVDFDGNYLAWLAKKGPGYGKAAVSLDGGTPVAVDLYSSYDKYRQKVYSTGLLENKQHTLTIYWTGQKNKAASDSRVDADAFDVIGQLVSSSDPAPLTWVYDQNDGRIVYLGSWSTLTTGEASGGNLYHTSTPGAGAVVSFTGTAVELLAKTGPTFGEVLVTLDGSDTETVDLYGGTEAYKQSIYRREGLTDGPHTLIMKCTGEKNDSSDGCTVDLDAVRITGDLLQGPALTRVQQDKKPEFTYEGVWSKGWTWSASGGSFASTSAADSLVTIDFNGTYLSWLARTAPWYGKAEVTLDGGAPQTIDLYSGSIGWKKTVYKTGLLDDGLHKLVIKWTGIKNGASSGTAISVDAADILVTTH